MNAVLGQNAVLLGFLACLAGSITLLVGLRKGRPRLLAAGRTYTWIVLAAALVAVFAMERALITRDFSLKFVAENGSSKTPALYNFAFENVGFSIVNQANPASAGDTLVFYATGMGQTTQPLATGQSIPLGPPYFNTPTVTVTIGGANAPVIYSIAAPPYVAGLYQMAVTVPAGLLPGNQAVVATSNGMQSNTVTIVTK